MSLISIFKNAHKQRRRAPNIIKTAVSQHKHDNYKLNCFAVSRNNEKMVVFWGCPPASLIPKSYHSQFKLGTVINTQTETASINTDIYSYVYFCLNHHQETSVKNAIKDLKLTGWHLYLEFNQMHFNDDNISDGDLLFKCG